MNKEQLTEFCWIQLRTCLGGDSKASIVDLGIVDDVILHDRDESYIVEIRLILPQELKKTGSLMELIRLRFEKVPNLSDVTIKVLLDKWTPDRMNERSKFLISPQ